MSLPKLTARNEADFIAAALRGERPDNEYCLIAETPDFLPEFCRLLDLPQADFDNSIAVRLSAETIYQHSRKHKEATAEAYRNICLLMFKQGIWLNIPCIGKAENITERICAYLEYEGKLWKMGIKFTQFAEIYITTLFRSNKKQRNRDCEIAIKIWG